MTPTEKPTATCPHCGDKFTKLKEGKIPTHDHPSPCRSVCPGSRADPKQHDNTPLWKDDHGQQARDFFEAARTELLIYGFAVVKQMAVFADKGRGTTACPLCGGSVGFSIASSNGHCAAACSTPKCINARE